MRKAALLLLSFLIFGSLTFAADPKTPPTPQELFAAYWTAEPGWHAEFQRSYGGLRLEVAQRAGYVDTFYFLYDETAGFSATMKMFDHNPSTKLEDRLFAGNTVWTTWAPMLPLQNPDPALALPSGTQLLPKVFLRNTTSQPQTANVKLMWRGELKSGVLGLPSVQLKPFETRLVDVQLLQQTQKIPPDAHSALAAIRDRSPC